MRLCVCAHARPWSQRERRHVSGASLESARALSMKDVLWALSVLWRASSSSVHQHAAAAAAEDALRASLVQALRPG